MWLLVRSKVEQVFALLTTPEHLNDIFEFEKRSLFPNEAIPVIQEVDESKSKASPTSGKSQNIIFKTSQVDIYNKPVGSRVINQGLLQPKDQLTVANQMNWEQETPVLPPNVSKQIKDRISEKCIGKKVIPGESISRIKSEKFIQSKEKTLKQVIPNSTASKNVRKGKGSSALFLPIRNKEFVPNKLFEQSESNPIANSISKRAKLSSPFSRLQKIVTLNSKSTKGKGFNSKSADAFENRYSKQIQIVFAKKRFERHGTKTMSSNLKRPKPDLNLDEVSESFQKKESLRSSLFEKKINLPGSDPKEEQETNKMKIERLFSHIKETRF